jgi:hypothetical protein
LEPDFVPCTDVQHLRQVSRHFFHLLMEIAEELFGVGGRVKYEQTCRFGRRPLESVHSSARRINEVPGIDQLRIPGDLESNLPGNDEVRFG